MRPVAPQPEPGNFKAAVRDQGAKFLQSCPAPTNKDYKRAAYWQLAIDDMYKAYAGVCAYLAHWIPRDIARATIDHFHPKVAYPQFAYQWSNFRLCSDRMNSYKDEWEDVLDPFTLQPDWFAIDFSSYFIEAGPGLTQNNIKKVKATIDRLRLNTQDDFVQQRCNVVGEYVAGEVTMGYLDRRYPFIADELRRQDLMDGIKAMYRTRSKK